MFFYYHIKNRIFSPSYSSNLNSTGIGLFLFFFLFWNLFSLFIIYSRHYFYELNLFPYDLTYHKIGIALTNQLYFLLAICVSFYIFRDRSPNKNHQAKFNYFLGLNRVLLITSIIIFSYLILRYGLILLSGNYLERFETEIPSYFMYVNTAIILIVLNNYRVGHYRNRFHNQFFILVFVYILLSLMLGSRSYAYKVFLCFLLIYYSKSEQGFGLRNVFHLIFIFIGVYITGQIVNVIRWYSTDFNYQHIILQLNADSFPELRSYSQTIEKLGTEYGKSHFGFIEFLYDFISRIFPSFIYDLFGLNRMDYYNSSWLYLDKIIYAGTRGDFGIRLGLVGEIDILLGKPYIFVFGGLYGYLFSLKKYQFFISVILINSVAYGLTSTYILITTIVIWIVIRGIYNRLPKKV